MDTSDISRNVSHTQEALATTSLNSLCQLAEMKTHDRLDVANYRPSVNIFLIPPQLLLIIPDLEKLMQSELFQAMWDREGASGKLTDSLDSVLLVWQNTKQKWDQLRKDIRNGTISFQNIYSHVVNFKDNYDKIMHEFILMNDDYAPHMWENERINQLKTFSDMHKRRRAASEILEIQKLFGFQGDFRPVQDILNLVCILIK